MNRIADTARLFLLAILAIAHVQWKLAGSVDGNAYLTEALNTWNGRIAQQVATREGSVE